MTAIADLAQNYHVAFLRYLPRREEVALAKAYELGREAVANRVSILELAQMHHDVLLQVLEGTSPDEVTSVATAASEFFLEVLATYDMAQRSLLGGE